MNKKTVSIIGLGWVGKAMQALFPNAIIYDPGHGFSDESAFNADFIFICVPTPLKSDPDGYPDRLDCSIVESTIKKCNPNSVIILRSTVNVGFCDYIKEDFDIDVVMMPEYIGETTAHPLFDETKRAFFVIGGIPSDREKIIELYQSVYNANVNFRLVTAKEAEVIKLTENRAIAFKMMQCQELYDACKGAGVDYYTIREAVFGDDPRMNLWFTFVYPDKRGFNNSKCLQKDVPAWVAWAFNEGNIDPVLTKALIDRSNKYAKENSNE